MKFLLPLLGLHCTDRLLLRDRQCFSGFRTLLTFTLFPTFSSWAPTRVLLPGSLVPIEVDQVWCGSNGKLYVLPSENGEVTQAPRRGRAAPAPAQSHSSRSRGRGRGAGRGGAGPDATMLNWVSCAAGSSPHMAAKLRCPRIGSASGTSNPKC